MNNFIHHYCVLYVILLMCILLTNDSAFSQKQTSDEVQKNIPRDAAVLKEEAKALLQKNEYTRAIQKLEKSLKLKPDYYRAAYDLALAYALRGSDLKAPSKIDRQRAWQEFKRTQQIATTHDISDPSLYGTMGWLSMMDALFSPPQAFSQREEKFKEAKRYFEESLKIATTSSTLNNLGVLYELKGDREHALNYYAEAANLQQARGKENYEQLQRMVALDQGGSEGIQSVYFQAFSKLSATERQDLMPLTDSELADVVSVGAGDM